MKLCADVSLETWTPNFSTSGQPDPRWTRARWAGVELCNSLEWAEWAENPVQVILCEACGYAGCASGGYVHVSQLDGRVLWTAPQIDTSDEWSVAQHAAAAAVRRLGAVAFPAATWEQWKMLARDLPAVAALPAANGRALADGPMPSGASSAGSSGWRDQLRHRSMARCRRPGRSAPESRRSTSTARKTGLPWPSAHAFVPA